MTTSVNTIAIIDQEEVSLLPAIISDVCQDSTSGEASTAESCVIKTIKALIPEQERQEAVDNPSKQQSLYSGIRENLVSVTTMLCATFDISISDEQAQKYFMQYFTSQES